MPTTDLSVLLLNCTLTHAPEASSCQLIAEQLVGGFAGHGVDGDIVRPPARRATLPRPAPRPDQASRMSPGAGRIRA